jgi:hypothetical protein
MIMENKWQFGKLNHTVLAQKQKLHQYSSEVGWTHPHEVHAVHAETTDTSEIPFHQKQYTISDKYWLWRQKGMNFTSPVRRPNGMNGACLCIFSLKLIDQTWDPSKYTGKEYKDPKGNTYKALSYVEARAEIYYKTYVELARETPEFKELQERYRRGEKLQICEVDGPAYMDEFPYNRVVNNSIEMTEENTKGLLMNEKQPFGHGMSLAIALMDKDKWVID